MNPHAPPGIKKPSRIGRGLIWVRTLASFPRMGANARAVQRSFTDELGYKLTVPVGPDGQPGYTLRAPSQTPYLGAMAIDGSRSDLRVQVDSSGASLGVSCFGRSEIVGDHEYCARPSWEFTPDGGDMITIDQNRSETIGPLETIRTVKLLPSGRMLIDWFFVREGWTFAAGVLIKPGTGEESEQASKQVLETWKWSN